MNEKKKREESMAPYWSSSEMFQQVERAFDDFRMGMQNFWFPRLGLSAPRIPMIDVRDEGTQYVLEADLPGMSKEDVNVEVRDNSLIIQAIKTEELEEKKEEFVRRERGQTSFYRRTPLPYNVNVDKIDANLNNGVLRIVLPKMERPEGEETKKVKVK